MTYITAKTLPNSRQFVLHTADHESASSIDRAMASQYIGGVSLKYNEDHQWVNLLDEPDEAPAYALLDVTAAVIEPLQAQARELEDPENKTIESLLFNRIRNGTRQAALKRGLNELGGSAVFAAEDGLTAGLLIPHYLMRQVGGTTRKIVCDYNFLVAKEMGTSGPHAENTKLAIYLKSLSQTALAGLVNTTTQMIVANELPSSAQIQDELHMHQPTIHAVFDEPAVVARPQLKVAA